MQRLKNNRGFTLVEVIIAIGMLAIISVIIIQLFITAKNLNQKATALDKSILASTSIIELFKSGKEPNSIKNDGFVEHAEIDEAKGITNINMYYDDDWNLLEDNKANAGFTLTAVIAPVPSIDIDSNSTSKAYTIKVTVIKTNPYPMEKNFKKEVYAVETIRYFD